jgi:uncharacterized membrane protein (DUF373 family)
MKVSDEFRHIRIRWATLNFYEKFEQAILSILTALIAIVVASATWHLIVTLFAVLVSGFDPVETQVFHTVFGMVLTVLIALEFKHSLLVVLHNQASIIQVRSVMLIAILALVRKFIILDLNTTTPGFIASLAGAILALGLVFWLIRAQDRRIAEEDLAEDLS